MLPSPTPWSNNFYESSPNFYEEFSKTDSERAGADELEQVLAFLIVLVALFSFSLFVFIARQRIAEQARVNALSVTHHLRPSMRV